MFLCVCEIVFSSVIDTSKELVESAVDEVDQAAQGIFDEAVDFAEETLRQIESGLPDEDNTSQKINFEKMAEAKK